jgi:EAL domain-containing protein (putative c-di-GMP-specific phosphodiesterase class I)
MQAITRDIEAKLVEFIAGIVDQKSQWQLIVFNFDQLLPHYKNEYQLKIAQNLITALLKDNEGSLFSCADYSTYLFSQNVDNNLMDKLIFQLRYLFVDDPLAYDGDGEENTAFSTIHQLEESFDDIQAEAKKHLLRTIRPDKFKKKTDPLAVLEEDDSSLFTPGKLVDVEKKLTAVDIGRVIRKQPICALVPRQKMRRVFDEIYINIAHLRDTMEVNIDLLSDKFLFRYLTQKLDLRVIDMIKGNPMRYVTSPVSLNVNIQTLLSPEFAEFDKAIDPALKVKIIMEIQLANIFEDMNAFLLAKDVLHKSGYRICVDGLTNLSFTQIDREKLGFDLAKVQWNADIEDDINSKENKELQATIKRSGATRVILCRCDNKQAVDYGQALGISLFQGRYLDTLVNPSSKIKN